MIASQTLQIFLGGAVALLYTTAVMTVGTLALGVMLGRRSSSTASGRLGLFAFVWLGFVVGEGIVSAVWLTLSLIGLFYPLPVWVFCVIGCLIASVMACGHIGKAVISEKKALPRLF